MRLRQTGVIAKEKVVFNYPIMRHNAFSFILRTLALAACFNALSALAQPKVPEGKQLRAPDISTIPGAITINAADFDRSGTNFIFPKKQWLAVNPKKGTEASISFIPKMPGGSYTFAVEVVMEPKGQASFTVQVGDEKLPAKQVPLLNRKKKDRTLHKLMWTEVPFKVGTEVTIHAQGVKVEDKFTARAKWTRVIMIPHNRQSMFIQAPAIAPPSGGPRGVTAPGKSPKDAKKEN